MKCGDNPSIHSHLLILVRVTGALESIPATKGKVTPWTGHQSAGLTQIERLPFTFTFTPMGSLESPVNQMRDDER